MQQQSEHAFVSLLLITRQCCPPSDLAFTFYPFPFTSPHLLYTYISTILHTSPSPYYTLLKRNKHLRLSLLSSKRRLFVASSLV